VTATDNAPLNITAASLLANDQEFDYGALSIVSIDTSNTLGSVTQNADGSFTYDGSVAFGGLGAGETATDSFQYMVDDGRGGTSTATVAVTITGTDNQTPVASFHTSAGRDKFVVDTSVQFDASASTDTGGSIAEYHFDFGDGNTLNTTDPTTSHT
jgi:uncharacterized protein